MIEIAKAWDALVAMKKRAILWGNLPLDQAQEMGFDEILNEELFLQAKIISGTEEIPFEQALSQSAQLLPGTYFSLPTTSYRQAEREVLWIAKLIDAIKSRFVFPAFVEGKLHPLWKETASWEERWGRKVYVLVDLTGDGLPEPLFPLFDRLLPRLSSSAFLGVVVKVPPAPLKPLFISNLKSLVIPLKEGGMAEEWMAEVMGLQDGVLSRIL